MRRGPAPGLAFTVATDRTHWTGARHRGGRRDAGRRGPALGRRHPAGRAGAGLVYNGMVVAKRSRPGDAAAPSREVLTLNSARCGRAAAISQGLRAGGAGAYRPGLVCSGGPAPDAEVRRQNLGIAEDGGYDGMQGCHCPAHRCASPPVSSPGSPRPGFWNRPPPSGDGRAGTEYGSGWPGPRLWWLRRVPLPLGRRSKIVNHLLLRIPVNQFLAYPA